MVTTAVAAPRREIRTMWGPGGNYTCFKQCGHQRCADRKAQRNLACFYCGRLIDAGEYFVELEHDATRVTRQAHLTCAESPR